MKKRCLFYKKQSAIKANLKAFLINRIGDMFFILANGGCLFLAGGLIFENSFLIKGGIFILIVQALIDAHFIISKYQRKKSIEKEQEKSDAKK